MTDARGRLLAFLGDEGDASPEAWSEALVPLWQAAHTVACPGCHHCASPEKELGCVGCGGTGRVPDPLALLRLYVGVAWECLENHVCGLACPDLDTHCVKSAALEAADAYLADPCEENRLECYEACSRELALEGGTRDDLLPSALASACQEIGVDAVRRVAMREVG